MQLEKMAAVVRPRGAWEAVDLGFQMAQAWWGAILRPWLAVVMPYFAIVTVALHAAPGWALFVVWWCKPLYERIPLIVLSRALFGSVPKAREIYRQMPRLWIEGIFSALIVLRLDPMRAFLAPVGRLEGLRGASYRQRVRVLKQGSDDAASSSWFTVICFLFEVGTIAALVGLLELLRPEEVAGNFWQVFTFLGPATTPAWYYYFAMALYFAGVTLISPFYVAGGFALYLNRRTQLEGWDVEVAFRRLARRLASGEPPRSAARRRGATRVARTGRAAAVLLAAGALASASLTWPAASAAQETAPGRDPQQVIDEILADSEFGAARTITRWKPRFELDDESDSSSSSVWTAGVAAFLGIVFKVILWVTAIAGVVLLVIAAARRLSGRRERSADDDDGVGPTIVAGLDISPQALPDDIVGAALERLRAGEVEEALSLLYRGALLRLVDRRHLPPRPSWTEGDCLRHLEGETSPVPAASPLVRYFSSLTSTWLLTAYAHRPPPADEVHELARSWSRHFGSADAPTAEAAPA